MTLRTHRPGARRALAGLVAAATVGAGLALVSAAPAHATVADVDAGQPISRSAIVERALSWTTQNVAYSQSSYFPAAAPRTGVGHSYRQDCSGFVAMAWDLAGSPVTGDYVSGSSAYDTRLASTAMLQPGDLLGVQSSSEQHVALFLGWSADDAGRHRYVDMVSESHTGTVASVATDQDLDGYWSTYTAYTDKLAVADTPGTLVAATGRTDQAVLGADGHVTQRWQTSPVAAWAGADLTANHRLPVMRTAPTVASAGGTTLDILGTGQSGSLLDYHYSGSTWTSLTLATSGIVYGLSATGGNGRIDVVGRQRGSDSAGVLVHGTLSAGGTWSGWLALSTAAPTVGDDPAVTQVDANHLDVVVENAAGVLELGRWTVSTNVWSWSTPFGSSRVSTPPAIASSNGTVTVTAALGGASMQDAQAAGSTAWSGWHPPVPTFTDTTPLAVVAGGHATHGLARSHATAGRLRH